MVYEKNLVVLPKFTEGILVGGHILIMIFSVCGNIAAMIIVGKSKAPKMSTKYFLMMLSFSDLLMTAIAPPAEISKMLNNFSEWIFGDIMCKLVPFFQILSAVMSALCLMAIAAERNFLIVRAMSSSTSIVNKIWEKWIIPIIAALIILLPIGCALPQIWFYTQVSFRAIPIRSSSTSQTQPSSSTVEYDEFFDLTTSSIPTTTQDPTCDIRYYCNRNNIDKRNIVYWSVTGSTYFFLLVWFLVSYISIYNFVKKHGRVRKQLENNDYASTITVTGTTVNMDNNDTLALQNKNKLAAGERHRKTLKLILGLILLHLCCRAPNWVLLVIINIKTVKITEATLTLLGTFHFLSTVNCALDPFLYVIWNHSLRASKDSRGTTTQESDDSCGLCKQTGNIFHYIFCRCCCKRKRSTVDDHIPADQVVIPTSSVWMWKTPTVYHVSSDNGGSWDNKRTTPSTSNRIFLKDRTLM